VRAQLLQLSCFLSDPQAARDALARFDAALLAPTSGGGGDGADAAPLLSHVESLVRQADGPGAGYYRQKRAMVWGRGGVEARVPIRSVVRAHHGMRQMNTFGALANVSEWHSSVPCCMGLWGCVCSRRMPF